MTSKKELLERIEDLEKSSRWRNKNVATKALVEISHDEIDELRKETKEAVKCVHKKIAELRTEVHQQDLQLKMNLRIKISANTHNENEDYAYVQVKDVVQALIDHLNVDLIKTNKVQVKGLEKH